MKIKKYRQSNVSAVYGKMKLKGHVSENEYGWHKANGPARIYDDGDWSWWQNGVPHRYYGVFSSWNAIWMINGEQIKDEES